MKDLSVAFFNLALTVGMMFFSPWIVHIAYGIVRDTFGGLPALTYWQVFMISWAIRLMFRPDAHMNKEGE